VIQELLGVAVQLQPACVFTATLAVPPALMKFWAGGVSVEVQPDPVPCCVTVNVCWPIVIDPVRVLVLGFEATE